MTQSEDNALQKPGQAEPLCLMLPKGLWLEFPDTWANRRGVMIVLRSLRRADGGPLVTYEHIAQQLGYADRRNVHNFWAEFEACGGDLAAFLQRRKKVDAEVVARCEQIWQAHPLWTCAQARAAEALPVHPIPDIVESVSPSGAGQEPPAVQADASVAALEDTLLQGEVAPSKLAQLWEGATGAILLAFILYYHGVSLEVIGRFFGVHKTGSTGSSVVITLGMCCIRRDFMV